MSTGNAWEKWYWRDWFSDPDVQSMSAVGRCGWFELLGWMWLNSTDTWEGSAAALRRLLKFEADEFTQFIQDVQESGVADGTLSPNGHITLTSRRRNRELDKAEKTREGNRIRQSRRRDRLKGHAPVTQESLPLSQESHATESDTESDSEEDLTGDRDENPTGGEYSPEFESAWNLRPRRAGSDDKRRAWQAWRARLREGEPASAMIEGMRRYKHYIEATDKEGTEFVMQGATFFGPSDPPNFDLAWDPPRKTNGEVSRDLNKMENPELLKLCEEHGIGTRGQTREQLIPLLRRAMECKEQGMQTIDLRSGTT